MQINLNTETTGSLLLKVIEKAKAEFGEHKEEPGGYCVRHETENEFNVNEIFTKEEVMARCLATEDEMKEVDSSEGETMVKDYFIARVVKVSGYKKAIQTILGRILFPPKN